MKPKLINGVLWLAFLLAMAASIHHLAWTFGTAEQTGLAGLGWIPAVGVDAGLAALAYTIQQRKKAQRETRNLWVGLVGFAAISALANLYHALAVAAPALPALEELINSLGTNVAKALLLSASLPVMYIFLGEIVAGDDATEADRQAEQAKRDQARADRVARTNELREERSNIEAKRAADEAALALLVAQREADQAAQSEPASEPERVKCEKCGLLFRSVNARNAHKCKALATASEPERVNGREK